ncbi:hypothetical protein BH09MYX1_BH09MYX1_11720 [soil metagenome]
MQPKWKARLGLLGLAGAVMWASAGCAQERDAINRVQYNAMDKGFFVGANLSDTSDDPEFYMRNTITDVPYGAAQDGLFTATYAQPVTRIKWEISEDALIARLTYEKVKDSDFYGAKDTDKGQVVAMFQIQSHFDIRRAYNPQTGEELNVIEENTSDRPWYARQYMRVDWSRNMVTNGYEVDTLSQIGIFGGVKFEPVSYAVMDPANKDAPAFDEKAGYFDVTTKAYATPQTIDTPWGEFPACFLPGDYGGSAPVGSCNPTEITLRLSFKKVVDTDFEPYDQTGIRQEAFGFFTEDRIGYDRHYGPVDQKWHRFAAKYNIWDKSHVQGTQCAIDYWRDASGAVGKYQVDGNGDFVINAQGMPVADPNGKPFIGTPVGQNYHRLASDGKTEAECAFTDPDGTIINPGSSCDEFVHKCTIPLRDRTTKTIPWYYGPDSPTDLYPSTREATEQWNVALKRATQIGKKADAERVGLDGSGFVTNEDDLMNRTNGGENVKDVIVLCHNPVIEGDHEACGKPGLLARVGDLRYSMVNLINAPQTPSPWGIMVDAVDPITGEKIATSVNEWIHVLDLAGEGTVDVLRWINGEITDDQIASGAYLHDFINASQLGTKEFRPETLSKEEIQQRIHSSSNDLAKLNGLTPADQSSPKEIRVWKASQNLSANAGPSYTPQFEAFRTKMIGSPLETQLIIPEQIQAAGMDPGTPVANNPSLVNRASILRGMNPTFNKWIHAQKEKTMAKVGACSVAQPEPASYVGLARQAQKLYPLPDKNDPNYAALKMKRDQSLLQWIREQFHVAVIAHEMGHSVGLRHNFAGSQDSLNYHNQYWQLRTQNGKEPLCKDVFTPNSDGATCVGPRWMDPVTEDEVNGLIWKWGSTTVMDYPGDATQDMNGLGPYDKAAMRFMYGQTVDVDEDSGDGTDKGKAYVGVLDGFGGIGGYTVGNVHYTQYQDKYKVLGTCGAQTDPKDRLSAKCTGIPLKYIPTRDMETIDKYGATVTAVRPDLVANFARTKEKIGAGGRKLIRHPYMFGSDEYADTGNLPIFRFDAGADNFEQMQYTISTYENRYIFDNFRRDRTTFNSAAVIGRTESRYLDRIQGFVKSFALLIGFEQNPDLAKTDPGGLMPLALASSDAFATFARILTRPEPGGYTLSPATPATGILLPFGRGQDINQQINSPGGDFKIRLGSGEGRWVHNDYDYTQGYYWSSYQKWAGSIYEKRSAGYFLWEAYNHFVQNSKEDFVDGRYKNLNFASVYPEQMRRLFANVMAGDPMTLGPYINNGTGGLSKDGFGTVRYLPWEKFDTLFPETTALTYPANTVVLDPLLGWEEQYPLMFSAAWFGASTLTTDFIGQMRIWTPNGSETVAIPLSEQVRFRDPNTGVVYTARTYGTEPLNAGPRGALGPVQKTMGARMIQYANELAARSYTATGTVTDSDGVAYPKYDVTNPKDFTIATKLKGFVSNLEIARELSLYLGIGIHNGL